MVTKLNILDPLKLQIPDDDTGINGDEEEKEDSESTELPDEEESEDDLKKGLDEEEDIE